jgi:parvulin-like peptidyl-prolyl isomerase
MANNEPEHIEVQHILIGFRGSVPGARITRSQEEARTLAYDLLEQARNGANFDELVKKYTDDSPPGKYKMSNLGVTKRQGEYARNEMVAAFGDVGFPLQVGEFGVADYDPRKSPYGWHIIKRVS